MPSRRRASLITVLMTIENGLYNAMMRFSIIIISAGHYMSGTSRYGFTGSFTYAAAFRTRHARSIYTRAQLKSSERSLLCVSTIIEPHARPSGAQASLKKERRASPSTRQE